MTKTLTLRRSGGSLAATLPKEMADRLHLEAGDTLLAVETPQGILLTPYSDSDQKALEAARQVSRTYRGALRELAK
jgi:putative addiction module antidote